MRIKAPWRPWDNRIRATGIAGSVTLGSRSLRGMAANMGGKTPAQSPFGAPATVSVSFSSGRIRGYVIGRPAKDSPFIRPRRDFGPRCRKGGWAEPATPTGSGGAFGPKHSVKPVFAVPMVHPRNLNDAVSAMLGRSGVISLQRGSSTIGRAQVAKDPKKTGALTVPQGAGSGGTLICRQGGGRWRAPERSKDSGNGRRAGRHPHLEVPKHRYILRMPSRRTGSRRRDPRKAHRR